MIIKRKVNAGGDYQSVYYAMIEITPEEATQYVALIDVCAKLETPRGIPANVAWYDYTPDWYEDEECEEPEDPGFIPECSELHVMGDCIYWSCYEKNCDVAYQTDGIYRGDLEKIARGDIFVPGCYPPDEEESDEL